MWFQCSFHPLENVRFQIIFLAKIRTEGQHFQKLNDQKTQTDKQTNKKPPKTPSFQVILDFKTL